MKKLMLLIACSLIACSEAVINTTQCTTEATVRDLTGLDGCGFVFELNNGVRLEPLRLPYCGTPPLPKEITDDPLFNFQFVDGKKVKIQFEETKAGSVCMVGPVVKITCITELDNTQD
jgi:hypothetical protein